MDERSVETILQIRRPRAVFRPRPRTVRVKFRARVMLGLAALLVAGGLVSGCDDFWGDGWEHRGGYHRDGGYHREDRHHEDGDRDGGDRDFRGGYYGGHQGGYQGDGN